MEKFPNNHSAGLSRVANVEGDVGKVEFYDLLLQVNDHLAGDLVELDIYTSTIIDMTINRTYRLTLHADVYIEVRNLDTYRTGFLVIDPQDFTCTIGGITKEELENTRPYNVTLYKFYSNKPNVIELIEKTGNMYGIRPGEYEHTEFLGMEFLT